ncbi:antibiotic transport system permease protein [Proteiniborus sp. DW1]|uniref:ABC transporter permease n=1 Tax=Proteiniborus sp. DW1 TaxID=1889883 RepID=UPI00092E15C2|nr:ABC transporter permease [Proteiniborus sp. DW1]SCG82187.1 antibiotic transport system permease protein [Proteiniborus sp. DW1]
MQVYKAFFKIILKNLSQIIIYFVVFIGITTILASSSPNTVATDFTEAKVNIVLINHDTNSKLVEGLRKHLSQNANIKDIPDDTQKLQDALFFREVEYILRIPMGFTEGLLSEKHIQIEKTVVPNSTSGIYIDNIINKYLNTVRTYNNSIEDLTEEELISYVEKDLSKKTDVKIKSSVEETFLIEKRAHFFNYMAYTLFSVLILGVSSVMIVFNDTELKRRNLCSPIQLKAMSFQLILGNITYAVIAWFTLILMSFIMYGSYMFTAKGLLLILNSFIFTLAVLSISFLIGNSIKSKNAMSAAANVFSLGSCFISGVFVPQDLMSNTVLKIASFTPNYWFVKANNSISGLNNINMTNLKPIFMNMLIVIGFALAMLAVSLVVIKQKRVSN